MECFCFYSNIVKISAAMTRIRNLEAVVRALYRAKDPGRADWADWLFEDHVFVVADLAEVIAERFDANKEYARAAAVLHDIADAKMSRFDKKHALESMTMARHLLLVNKFNPKEVEVIVDDAIKHHSCRNGNVPRSPEEKIFATADAVAHLTTDFYEKACERTVFVNRIEHVVY